MIVETKEVTVVKPVTEDHVVVSLTKYEAEVLRYTVGRVSGSTNTPRTVTDDLYTELCKHLGDVKNGSHDMFDHASNRLHWKVTAEEFKAKLGL